MQRSIKDTLSATFPLILLNRALLNIYTIHQTYGDSGIQPQTITSVVDSTVKYIISQVNVVLANKINNKIDQYISQGVKTITRGAASETVPLTPEEKNKLLSLKISDFQTKTVDGISYTIVNKDLYKPLMTTQKALTEFCQYAIHQLVNTQASRACQVVVGISLLFSYASGTFRIINAKLHDGPGWYLWFDHVGNRSKSTKL